MREIRSIGFFGDSFCQEVSNPHSVQNHYDTYLQQVANHYTAEIACVGVSGSSAWDLVLQQWPRQLSEGLPDVCVMVWTDAHRLYHYQQRNINCSTSEQGLTPQHRAAREYYHHLYDTHKHLLEYQALLYYFDRVMLSAYPHQTFIHLWSFGEWSDHAPHRWYAHQWQQGTTILPALHSLITDPTPELPTEDARANHLAGHTVNQWIAEQIIQAVEQNHPTRGHTLKG